MKEEVVKKELCLECLGAKYLYNGEDYNKCHTCKGKGKTSDIKNDLFLLSIRIEEEVL